MMKAIGFEISLGISLSKFVGSSSIPCAFVRQNFSKHLQISDGVTERNEHFGVVCIGKFFGFFHTKSFIWCCCYTGEKLTKSVGDSFAIRYYFFVYFQCRTSKFWFRFAGKYTFQCLPERSTLFHVFIQRFLLYFCLALLIRLLALFLWRLHFS